ncbi:MAG: oxaloacetate decarboxylase, partial [Bacteroidales bacterium]|nr:oxaloacetate decarboxylase [Bacteroidales bacterium]
IVRSLTQKYIDDFLGYYIEPKNRLMNSLLIGPGLPGGMMGSLMADLQNNLESLNKWKAKNSQPPLTQDTLLVKLFNEVTHIWPMVGYPPLVTPYSQYVKNLALMNVLQMEKGKERWSLMDENVWDMLLGKGGKLPGTIAPELKALAEKEGRQEFTDAPQSLYPDALDDFRREMADKGWDVGQDEEELFELAMHPQQYRLYRSGDAKKAFEADLAKRREEGAGLIEGTKAAALPHPTTMFVDVDGEKFRVTVAYDEASASAPAAQPVGFAMLPPTPAATGELKEIVAPLEGKFYLTKETSETPLKVGDNVTHGSLIGYIEAMKVFNAIKSDIEGQVVSIDVATGSDVEEDTVLVRIKS